MCHILEKIKKKTFLFAFLYGHMLKGYSMGSHFGEKNKFFFLRFCMDIYYKALVWAIFWRKLKKKKNLRFCMYMYNKATVWVIFWIKLKKKKFYLPVWTYTIR
jgi:hypothetical protein